MCAWAISSWRPATTDATQTYPADEITRNQLERLFANPEKTGVTLVVQHYRRPTRSDSRVSRWNQRRMGLQRGQSAGQRPLATTTAKRIGAIEPGRIEKVGGPPRCRQPSTSIAAATGIRTVVVLATLAKPSRCCPWPTAATGNTMESTKVWGRSWPLRNPLRVSIKQRHIWQLRLPRNPKVTSPAICLAVSTKRTSSGWKPSRPTATCWRGDLTWSTRDLRLELLLSRTNQREEAARERRQLLTLVGNRDQLAQLRRQIQQPTAPPETTTAPAGFSERVLEATMQTSLPDANKLQRDMDRLLKALKH